MYRCAAQSILNIVHNAHCAHWKSLCSNKSKHPPMRRIREMLATPWPPPHPPLPTNGTYATIIATVIVAVKQLVGNRAPKRLGRRRGSSTPRNGNRRRAGWTSVFRWFFFSTRLRIWKLTRFFGRLGRVESKHDRGIGKKASGADFRRQILVG